MHGEAFNRKKKYRTCDTTQYQCTAALRSIQYSCETRFRVWTFELSLTILNERANDSAPTDIQGGEGGEHLDKLKSEAGANLFEAN